MKSGKPGRTGPLTKEAGVSITQDWTERPEVRRYVGKSACRQHVGSRMRQAWYTF